MPDHVHMCIAIPPKHAVASVIGFLKGKSAIAIARLSGKQRNFSGEHLARHGPARRNFKQGAGRSPTTASHPVRLGTLLKILCIYVIVSPPKLVG
jgi:REP element-mobilizing transposase RayT